MAELTFGVMRECPLCERTNCVFQVVVLGEGLHYRSCECGLFFQLWAMLPEALAEYYKFQYRNDKGTPSPAKENIQEEIARADSIVQFLDGNVEPRYALDIGSSTGFLLKKLRDVYGCQVMGIEPGDNFREYSRGLGLNVLNDIEHLDGNQKFDLITVIHVLEHWVEPMKLLEKVRGLLADNGKLIVEVPFLMYAIEHPILFTKETFRAMLNKAGFVIDRLVVDNSLLSEGRAAHATAECHEAS